ncbi:MAG: Uma2 family endonuclease [Chloroflexi bacterium]|nr:Uma2 family endonuclease [Chloroflexota bacterium]
MVVQTLEPPMVTTRVSGEELAALGEIGRCELVEGEIIMRSPTGNRHGRVELKLGKALDDFVSPRKLGIVAVGEVGIYTRRHPDTVRGADVLFISNERAARRSSKAYLDIAPDLIVEVLSPDDRWNELTQKLREYFSIGVRLVWVADPEAEIVYAYRALTDVREFRAGDLLPGDEVLPDFSVPVASLFEE